ncbi:PAS domain S-box protein [Polaromonas sp. Pch-P]|uniref:PAS domain S-box protein n=1 Tax=Polaromonas sp. Pch-P TaxID=2082385 RepID=UPI001893ED7C|nr:PAS domain S-box protein [Polaromonas sp. Pch-P]
MKRDENLSEANERLQAEMQALADANDKLRQELAEQQRVVETLQSDVQGLCSLASISADWYWEQDADCRFIAFAAEKAPDDPENLDPDLNSALGKTRWDLPGAFPLSMSWFDHRALLDAHQPFRDFEYIRVLGDGVAHYFSASGVPVFDKHRQFTGYRGTTRDITVSRRTEEKERKAAQFLDDIVENIPMAVHLKSVENGFRIVAWNKASEILYGIKREEAMGRTTHDLLPKADADRMHASDLELMASGDMQEFPDLAAESRDRGRIRVHLRKLPLKDASGNITHILVTSEDITERIVAEARLRHSQARFRSLTRLSSDWYWELDEQFRFTRLSGGVTEQAGVSLSDYLGKTRWEIDTSPRNRAAWMQHRAQLERHETFRNFEYEHQHKDGRVLVFCISGEPVLDAQGNFTGYRGVGSDITERKQAEAALHAGEARFRAVVGALAEGVVLRDADGKIIDCNSSAERIFGKSLAQMKGLPSAAMDWERLREDGSPMPEDEWPSVLARQTGQAQSNSLVCYRRPDGSIMWGLVNVQPLFDGETNVPTGFVTSIADISKRKQAEIEIVRLNVDLETRVSRRTAQLEAANKEIEAFSYSVAHDLRTPLSTIDGFCVLLQKNMPPETDDRARHYLSRIRSSVRRMGELTDGLLSLARLSRTSIVWAPVDISAEVDGIVRRLKEAEPGRDAVVTIEPGLVARADRHFLLRSLKT